MMTHSEVKSLQRDLNAFFGKHLKNWAHLIVDGDYGALTKRFVRESKYFIGYETPNSGDESGVTTLYRHRLDHPTSKIWVRASTRKRGLKRRARQHASVYAPGGPGVGVFDGRKVAKAAIPILQWCRDHGWHGTLVSGYRTPEYSEQLCYNMCGRPACPGTCAGRATNHAYATPTRFAVDVSDYVNFRGIVARCPVSPRIWNNLPRDRVHFSPSGN